MEDIDPGGNDRKGVLTVGLGGLSLALTVITIAALTSTVVVTAVRDADVLSVVALALAIIAFVVQIILYIVQQSSAAAQGDRAAALYTQTVRALASIEEKAEGTKQTVGQMNDRLLGAALAKATAETAASEPATPGGPNFLDRVVERTREIVEDSPNRAFVPIDESRSRKPRQTFLDARHVDRSILPAAIDALKGLKPVELSVLQYLAKDLASAERRGTPEAAGLRSINHPKELHEKGLVIRKRAPWSKAPVFVLTPLGKAVAQLLLSPLGKDVDPDVTKQRNELRAWQAGLERMMDELRRDDNAVPVEED